MKEHLDHLLSEHARYKRDKIDMFPKPKKPIPLVKQHYDIDYLEYMQTSFENAGKFPGVHLFKAQFPFTKINFAMVQAVPVDSFHVLIANIIRERLNSFSKNFLHNVAEHAGKHGIDDTAQNYVSEMRKRTGRGKDIDIQLRQNARDNYEERLNRPQGMFTGITKLDDLIGGMNEGTVSVIAGFTSHMKTTFAMNIAYLNSYRHNYNIAYFSLETPKDMMYDQLLCRHSYDMKFPDYPYIPHGKVRLQELSSDEENYLFDVIEPDLHAPYHALDTNNKPMYDDDGNPVMKERGLVTFFDLSDFDTFSFEEISNTLKSLDDKLDGNLDAIIVDYVQLCKFVEGGTQLGDDNRIINAYIAYFRKLAQGFRSGNHKKKLIVILLAQINRGSWDYAKKHEGRYDLTCLADANELERGAARVITTYTDENMKITKEAQVQLLKNRHGATMNDPERVFADPEAYVYGDEDDAIGQPSGGYIPQNNVNVMDALSMLDANTSTIAPDVFD